MTPIRPPQRCCLYRPGHTPHWIQARRAWEDQEHPARPTTVLSVGGEGTIVLDIDGEAVSVWNHEPQRFIEALAEHGNVVFQQLRWGLLIVGGPFGYLFCVMRPGSDHVECLENPPTGSPLEQLRETGGFSLPASEVVRGMRDR